MIRKIKHFVKDEIVLIISLLLAVVSSVIVGVDKEYIGYIDFRTLGLLFCLMAIVGALNRQGIFFILAKSLLKRVKSTRSLCVYFSLLCFFSSMLITNDVALITFVPFTILTLDLSGNKKPLITLVVIETISANLGSMLTPIGNPQNLYLFSNFDMTISDFASAILPYAVLSLVLIIISCFFVKNESISPKEMDSTTIISKKLVVVYAVLFAVAMLTVFRVLHFLVLMVVTVVTLLIVDRRVFVRIDYSLLFTFVFLFIFIGNLGRIDAISTFLGSIINGNEVLVGIGASQVFSNVPAAILLSGFTDNARDLLVGVNLGGLGTLIASMASLISFKLVAKANVRMSKYIVTFTVYNLIFLALNIALWSVIK